MSQAETKRRPRVSLLSLLLLTAVIALGATVVSLWWEVGPLRAENRRLRDEVGELSILDPTKLHAIQVATDNELEWKWRVWVPEGRSYRVRFVSSEIPKDGVPNGGGWVQLDRAGEQVVVYRIQRDASDAVWVSKLSAPSGSIGSGGSELDWVGEANCTEFGGVRASTRAFEPDSPVVLIRYRTANGVGSSSEIPDPADGFLIWLEPR